MKNLTYIILLLSLFSCSKNENDAILIKDCTGAYLRIDNEDFYITNYEIVDHIESSTHLNVDFKNKKESEQKFIAICMMHHETAGVIEITKIK